MFGLLFTIAATFFHEIGTSIGKTEVRDHKESIYTMGCLNLLWSTIILLVIAFARQEFVFSFESLPTFSIRALLEIAQFHIGILAIIKAERSAVGFIMIGTIPLLLAIDIFLGYAISFSQIIGITIIILALIFLLMNHGIRTKGFWYIIFITINAAATISLYKYDITHFNSVEAEQSLTLAILLVYFTIMAFFVARENPIRFLKQRVFLVQSFSMGLATAFMSFAYLFAPASIITTAKRALAILWATLSGNIYFHEKHLFVKMISYAMIISGLIFLIT